MRLLYKTRGAVSLFLIIILLPTMTIAGVFIDMARTKLAHEVAVSSADLALNTVLTDYDKELKDYFGLLASAQNTESIISISKQYFADSMISAGVNTADAIAYVDHVYSAFAGDKDIQDMLQISVVDNSTQIEKTPNGALNNPALLKNGIIEFMKYRAPVNAAAELFAKLTDSEVEKEMENVSKETEMIEKRNDFYQAERALIEQAEKAYNAIKAYQNYETARTKDGEGGGIISENGYIESMSKFLINPGKGNDGNGPEGSFEEIFKKAHITLVMNLYNTHDPGGLNQITLIKSQRIQRQPKNTNFTPEFPASAEKIKTSLKKMNDAYSTYCSKRNALETAWSKIDSMKESDWPIQYWVKLTKSCMKEYNEYKTAAEELWMLANKVANAVENSKEEAMDEMMTRPSSNYITYATADENGNITLQQTYQALWNSYSNNYKGEIESQNGSRSYRNINNQIYSLDTPQNDELLDLAQLNPISTIRNWVDKYIQDAKGGSDLAKTAEQETYKLLKLIDDYHKAFEAWKTVAFDPELDDSDIATMKSETSDPMDGGDRQQITHLQQKGLDHFSKNSVKELRQRLTNIHVLWDTVGKDLNEIKYNNTPIIKLVSYPEFRLASGVNESRIVLNKDQLLNYASESFSFSIGTEIQRIIIPRYPSSKYPQTSGQLQGDGEYVITDSFYPDIEHTKLDLYVWMKDKFDNSSTVIGATEQQAGMSVQDKGEAKNADKKVDGKSNDTKDAEADAESENITGQDFSDWSGAALPSGGPYAAGKQKLSAKIGEVSDYAQSIFSDFSGTFKRSLVSARDDLFTISYVFDMFTWDTFEKEGCYALLSDSEKQSAHPENSYAANREEWMADDNKTLTLTPRDAKNNYAYGGEVEYILYGKGKNSDNKSSAYARIYMTRYAFDLAPVFKFYWDDSLLSALAAAIEGFIHVPQGVTKTVACLAITAAEAAIDLKILKTGQPVLLYKSEKTDLVCNYKSVFAGGENNNNGNKIKDRVALQYSDYLKVYLLVKMIGGSEKQIYLRIGDVIQANLGTSIGDTGFDLAKSQVFYSFSSTVRIPPMWSKLLHIDDLGDLSESTGWRTTSIKMTSGY